MTSAYRGKDLSPNSSGCCLYIHTHIYILPGALVRQPDVDCQSSILLSRRFVVRGFVFMWFDPLRLRANEFGSDSADVGFALPSNMAHVRNGVGLVVGTRGSRFGLAYRPKVWDG